MEVEEGRNSVTEKQRRGRERGEWGAWSQRYTCTDGFRVLRATLVVVVTPWWYRGSGEICDGSETVVRVGWWLVRNAFWNPTRCFSLFRRNQPIVRSLPKNLSRTVFTYFEHSVPTVSFLTNLKLNSRKWRLLIRRKSNCSLGNTWHWPRVNPQITPATSSLSGTIIVPQSYQKPINFVTCKKKNLSLILLCFSLSLSFSGEIVARTGGSCSREGVCLARLSSVGVGKERQQKEPPSLSSIPITSWFV